MKALSVLVFLPFALAFVRLPTTTTKPSYFRVIDSRIVVYSDGQPSDYDSADLRPIEKRVAVDFDDEDAHIRDALKRELLLLASVTNRGEFASKDELNIVIDLVTQLEALNPTFDPASNCDGEWDLCLSSTQLFRSSPFFQTLRVAFGGDSSISNSNSNNKAMGENFFDLHDRATTASRIGRVRQSIQAIQQKLLISEVDLEVGILPGLPFRVSGTVVTEADLTVVSAETWELRIRSSQVKGSNIPIFNQFLDDLKLELPVRDIYTSIRGQVPVVPMKTFYVDEGMRITRDVDDNFFVFSKV